MIPQRKKREKYFPSEHGPSPPSAMQEMQETRVRSLGQGDPLEDEMATHSRIVARSLLAGYSPWGCKESDTAEQLTTHIE